MELTLASPVRFVPRVGPIMAKRLKKLGIETVENLLFYPPFRYNDFSLVSEIATVQPGETVTVRGTVTKIKNYLTKTGKNIQEAEVADATGILPVIWFNQRFLLRTIHPGDQISLSGEITWFGHRIVLSSPQYEFMQQGEGATDTSNKHEGLHTGRLVPVYSETEGVSSKWLRGRIHYLLSEMLPAVTEYMPREILSSHGLMGIAHALSAIHFPETLAQAKEGGRRLAFDELFLLELRAWQERKTWEKTKRSFPMTLPKDELLAFVHSLPFRLTSDQKRAIDEIMADLSRPIAMHRLLEGDVGSGKTVVAAVAMYVAYRNGMRSLLMAPTQILAEQHYQTLVRLLSTFDITVHLVTSDTKKNQKSKIKNQKYNSKIKNVQAYNSVSLVNILVGTHALLSENRELADVGLVVIDEQQRFGVEQRAALVTKQEKGNTPHLLTMTATPIPRTMALTIFGNLDLSVLDEMPEGRERVKTWVVPKEKREKAYQWIRNQIEKANGQAFVICPLIEESETRMSVKAVTTEYERLKQIFPEFTVGLLHGRMKAKEKTQVLGDFRLNKVNILVTTPVVEVGIDIPSASIMVIEAADRFGLAQLHQLRGRVGRGGLPSYCLLFTERDDTLVIKRLKALETTFSGPELAELDLTLRGPGELFGTKQHGLPILAFATLSDSRLIAQTSAAVQEIVALDPNLTRFPLLRQKLQSSTIKMISQD